MILSLFILFHYRISVVADEALSELSPLSTPTRCLLWIMVKKCGKFDFIHIFPQILIMKNISSVVIKCNYLDQQSSDIKGTVKCNCWVSKGIEVPKQRPWLSFITVTSQWARWRLKSPASWVFTQLFIQAQIKENIKAPRHWPLCGPRWIPRTNGQ